MWPATLLATVDPDERRRELVRHWSSWYTGSGASCWRPVKLVDDLPRNRCGESFTLSFQPSSSQADVWLRRGDTDMDKMQDRYHKHPLAVGSEPQFLKGKVNEQSGPECHESIYNIKFKTVLGFNLTFGYSRHMPRWSAKKAYESGIRHAWIAF